MDIGELDLRLDHEKDKKLTRQYISFRKLIAELKKREMPPETVNSINRNIEKINAFSGSKKDLRKQIRKSQSSILALIEKELNLVTKNLYRMRWMVIGMAIGAGMDKKACEEGRQLPGN